MKTQNHWMPGLLAGCCLICLTASAATRYVWQGNPRPKPPFNTWATAARTIQEAVDAASAGDEIVVTNGVYAPVSISRPLTLRSVNGPNITLIDGNGSTRCVALIGDVIVSGFTLTNGSASEGGGVWCASPNAVVVTNCVLAGNSADYGGGAYGGTLNNCTLMGNSANEDGGGALGGTLNNCTLTDNSARSGGGASSSTLNNCVLTGNSSSYFGGGVNLGTLYNCILIRNSATRNGGGAFYTSLQNCTVVGNSAGDAGGGGFKCEFYNSVIYYNTAPKSANFFQDQWSGPISYSCTRPIPTNGVGNISDDPLLASANHLSSNSPCIGAGNSAYARGVDIDGEPWFTPPCMGADQYLPGVSEGPLHVALFTPYTNVASGFVLKFTGSVEGHPTLGVWNFGDGVVVSNQYYRPDITAIPTT